MSIRMAGRLALGAAALTLAAVGTLPAQDIMDVAVVHGYGGWGYGRTIANDNPNMFNYAHRLGDYSHSEFALNVSVPVNERLSVTAQPFWHQGHHANQTASGMDYAFGEWKFSDLARFRAGLVKQPFGIYTEVFDVGTVRPFATLPSSIYGPAGTVGKAYSGIGLTGARYGRGGWGVQYDVYGGGLEVSEWDVALQVAAEGADTTGRKIDLSQSKVLRNVVGGRLVFNLPIDGLSVGASSYTGTRPVSGVDIRRSVVGAQSEFLSDRWSLRGEYAHTHEADVLDRTSDGGYVEGAYRLTRLVQVAGMYNSLRTDLPGADPANVARARSLLEHEEWGGGLNLWFAPNFVLKSSYHVVTGNRFASPEQPSIRAAVANGAMIERTNVVLFGAQMSF
jgi:hypothetical protein